MVDRPAPPRSHVWILTGFLLAAAVLAFRACTNLVEVVARKAFK